MTVLRLAPGSGLVSRRPTALVYAAAPDAVLLEAFAASPHGGELQAIASATVAAGFAVGPFVAVSWAADVRVMAFGDIAVETDQPSLPMLSGAGSRTWVEHTLVPADGTVVVEVAGADTDDATDLVAGTVPAGGFRLTVGEADEREPAEPVSEPATQAGAAPSPEPTTPAAEPTATSAPTSDETLAVPTAVPPPAAPADALAPPPAGARAGIAAGLVTAPAAPEPTDVDLDVTLPPPASDALLSDVRDGRSGSLVDAKLCPAGHANAPTAAACAVCGDFLAPGTSSVVHVTRPSLGRLELDDGEVVELDAELLVGRNPDRDDDPRRASLRRIRTPGDKVSRSHLEVRFQGWDVLVVDCASTNGTFVVAHPGGQVVPLEPGRPLMVEPGATVYFGSRSMTVLGRS